MALPILIGLGSLLASGLGAVSSIGSANAAAKAAEANADNAYEDSKIADRNATLVLDQATQQQNQIRVMGRKVAGSIRANIGASGLQSDGSAEDILLESAANAEQDALNVGRQGRLQAQGYQTQAARGRRYATALRDGADSTVLGGYLSAGGKLLGGVSDFASKLPSSKSISRVN